MSSVICMIKFRVHSETASQNVIYAFLGDVINQPSKFSRYGKEDTVLEEILSSLNKRSNTTV